MLQPGEEVQHPQWGRGTVLFDKAHCIAIRFIEHGQVNFSQEEWLSQKSPPERFRGIASKGGSAISELEYSLQEAVENMELTEEQALIFLRNKAHPLEIRRQQHRPNLADARQYFLEHPTNKNAEEDFYKALLSYIKALTLRSCHDQSTFSNIEDAIQESALEVWQRLPEFDTTRSSFTSWVGMITMHNIRDAMRRLRTFHGQPQRPVEIENRGIVQVDEEQLPSRALPVDLQFEIKEGLAQLSVLDRVIVQMTTDGLTLRETGEALNMSYEGVRKRLKKLKLRLTKAPS